MDFLRMKLFRDTIAGQDSTPLSLEVMSFNTILMKIWKSSNLPNQILDAMKRQTYGNDEFRSSKELTILHLQILEKARSQILNLREIPKYWKTKLASALYKLNTDILCWSKIMVINLVEVTWSNVKCCYVNIVISQKGLVERRKTIINILQESKFKVKFTPEFLSCYCIERKMINIVYRNVLISISNRQRGSRKRKHNGYPSCLEDMEEIKRQVLSAQDVRKYWLVDWIKARQCPSKMYWRCNLIQYVTTKQCVEIMQYFYSIMDESDRQDHLFKAFKFVIKNNLAITELIIFFYENLDTDRWNVILERNFHLIFFKVMKCWRHRSLAVTFYKSMKGYIDVESFRLILEMFKMNCRTDCSYNELIPIFRTIWMETPLHIRKHPRIALYAIADLVALRTDFYLLIDLIKDFEPHERIDVIAQVVFTIINDKRSHLVDKCLNILSENGMFVGNYEDLINKYAFKQYILNCLRQLDLRLNAYNYVKDFFEGKLERKFEMFEDIFRDRSFIVKFVTYLCRAYMEHYKIDCLISWFCSKEILAYIMEKVKSEKWIIDIYERFLLDPKAHLFLHKPIVWFDLKGNMNEIKSELIKKPKLINTILHNLLRQRKCDILQTYLIFLYGDLDEHKNPMEKFLLSDVGVQAVINHLVIYLENAESDLSLRFSLENTLDLFSDFKDSWLTPYNLQQPFDNKLAEYGHPNLKPVTLKVKGVFDLKPYEVMEARRIVDAKYRFLRAIINGDFARDIYRNVSKGWDLTEKSVAMANDVGIFVGVHL